MAEYKILICGGRQYGISTDTRDENANTLAKKQVERAHDLLTNLVQVLMTMDKEVTIIHGDAIGADRLGGAWAEIHDLPVQKFPADWDKYKKAAGPIRNTQMLKEGKPDLVVAFPGGFGTNHMIKIATQAGVKVYEVKDHE